MRLLQVDGCGHAALFQCSNGLSIIRIGSFWSYYKQFALLRILHDVVNLITT